MLEMWEPIYKRQWYTELLYRIPLLQIISFYCAKAFPSRQNFQREEQNLWGKDRDFHCQTPNPFCHILCFLLLKSFSPIFLSNPISSCLISTTGPSDTNTQHQLTRTAPSTPLNGSKAENHPGLPTLKTSLLRTQASELRHIITSASL